MKIDVVTMQQAVDAVEQFIVKGKPSHMVATVNAEMAMLANEDDELAAILARADLVVADGAGVVWAAARGGTPLPERVAGYDLTQQLLTRAANIGYGIYLFGGSPGVADQAKRMAEKRYPGLHIVGVRNGFFSPDEETKIIAEIRSCRPDILLVALGVPKQEKWLSSHLEEIGVPVAIGVGGTFDVMAGITRRAPVWMQRAKLEWLFRLLMQPQRAIRMLALPRFVWRVLCGKKH